MRMEALHPEMAVILALALHPAFPRHALPGLPAMCQIVQEAIATGAHDTLMPVLAAVWAVCRNCAKKLTYCDAASVCTALLGVLPTPDPQHDPCRTLTDPPVDGVSGMVAAVACVAAMLTAVGASTSIWQKLHTEVLQRLCCGLSALSQDAVCACFNVADLFGTPQAGSGVTAEGWQSLGADVDVSLLSLSAKITSCVVHAQGNQLLSGGHDVAPSQGGLGNAPGIGGTRLTSHGPQSDLGMAIANLCMDVLVPSHAHAFTSRTDGAAAHGGLHDSVCAALSDFLESVLSSTHGIFLPNGKCSGAGDRCISAAQDQEDTERHSTEHHSPIHPLTTTAVALGWLCISNGWLVLLVERCERHGRTNWCGQLVVCQPVCWQSASVRQLLQKWLASPRCPPYAASAAGNSFDRAPSRRR